MKMYCIRLANSHMFLNCSSGDISLGGSDDSLSSRARLRGAMATEGSVDAFATNVGVDAPTATRTDV